MGYFKYLIPVILAMVFWYVFFAIITISTANANTPDWVLGKGHKSFPEMKYLVGVGVSEKSPIKASQSARTELIKTISIHINSVVSDYNSREKSISKTSIFFSSTKKLPVDLQTSAACTSKSFLSLSIIFFPLPATVSYSLSLIHFFATIVIL